MKNLRPVIVDWLDSHTDEGWEEYQGDHDLRCQSVGFLFRETADRVVLALNKNSHMCGHYITIPRCCIVGKPRFLTEEPEEVDPIEHFRALAGFAA